MLDWHDPRPLTAWIVPISLPPIGRSETDYVGPRRYFRDHVSESAGYSGGSDLLQNAHADSLVL
jgi:hypothetical protein